MSTPGHLIVPQFFHVALSCCSRSDSKQNVVPAVNVSLLNGLTPFSICTFPEYSHSFARITNRNLESDCSNPIKDEVPKKTLAITPFFPIHGRLGRGPRHSSTWRLVDLSHATAEHHGRSTCCKLLQSTCPCSCHHVASADLHTPAICAIMISPSCCRRAFGLFRLLADCCDLPFHELAIMLPSSFWALPPAGRLLRSALS
jgi:hypothetical protein